MALARAIPQPNLGWLCLWAGLSCTAASCGLLLGACLR